MKAALDETERRRGVQQKFNIENNITPKTVSRAPEAQLVEIEEAKEAIEQVAGVEELPKDRKAVKGIIEKQRAQMFVHAKKYEFEQAAVLRDRISALEKYLLSL